MSGANGIRGILVRPGHAPEIAEIEQGLNKDRTNLEVPQKVFEGYIDSVALGDGAMLVFAKGSKFTGSPNRFVMGKNDRKVFGILCGPFIICGQKRDGLGSLPEALMRKWLKRLSNPRVLIID